MPLIPLVLGVLLLTTSVVAKPIPYNMPTATLLLSRQISKNGTHNVLKNDQARARYLAARVDNKAPQSYNDIISRALDGYVADIQVGNPPNQYSLIVDTGSSNSWVGANPSNPYHLSRTSKQLPDVVITRYGSGFFAGVEYEDEVTLSPGLTVQQSIGVAVVASKGIAPLDGILGLGPPDLTNGTLFPDMTKEIPTVVDNLHSQGKISSRLLGLYLEPYSPTNNKTGILTYGGIPAGKAKGDIFYVPVTSRGLASHFWGIDQSIKYGSTAILSQSTGIVDSGTTMIMIPTDAFKQYQKMTGATADSKTGLLSITPSQFKLLQPLSFIIGGRSLVLVPDAQIWPRALNGAIGGEREAIYLVIVDSGVKSTEDPEDNVFCVNGLTFLQRFLTGLDSDNRKIGFAETDHTDHEMNYML
jgi:hypothetical protein